MLCCARYLCVLQDIVGSVAGVWVGREEVEMRWERARRAQ